MIKQQPDVKMLVQKYAILCNKIDGLLNYSENMVKPVRLYKFTLICFWAKQQNQGK